jgi:hypothetical protein
MERRGWILHAEPQKYVEIESRYHLKRYCMAPEMSFGRYQVADYMRRPSSESTHSTKADYTIDRWMDKKTAVATNIQPEAFLP